MYALGKRIRPLIGNLKIGKKIETKIIKNNILDNSSPPIFIIGLPRSGSTLLYQLIAHYFKTSYFSNLASLCYTYPATATYLTSYFQKNYKIKSFKSNFGFTSGLLAPSEAGGIYRYWFHNLGQSTEYVKLTCHKIADILNAPFIWKNLHLSFKVEQLSQIFPNCLFVLIERDLQFICQSAYKRTINGPGLGIKGLTKDELSKSSDIMKSVVAHIKQVNSTILNSLDTLDVNVIKVQYAELCDDYAHILGQIAEAYNGFEYKLQQRFEFNEGKFKANNYRQISEQEWRRLCQLLQEV